MHLSAVIQTRIQKYISGSRSWWFLDYSQWLWFDEFYQWAMNVMTLISNGNKYGPSLRRLRASDSLSKAAYLLSWLPSILQAYLTPFRRFLVPGSFSVPK